MKLRWVKYGYSWRLDSDSEYYLIHDVWIEPCVNRYDVYIKFYDSHIPDRRHLYIHNININMLKSVLLDTFDKYHINNVLRKFVRMKEMRLDMENRLGGGFIL